MTMGMMMIMMIIRMSRSLDHILESSESSSLSTSMDINTRSLTRYRQDTITLLYQLIYAVILDTPTPGSSPDTGRTISLFSTSL